jgi:N6-L-threonylcarbamoyladenine synthase
MIKRKTSVVILGIETSCDECAAAVVADGNKIIADVVASQIDIHRPYYGVVPEIASRKHVEWIAPIVNQVLKKAELSFTDIHAIAATYRPGLIGSLLVGLSFAKGLAFSLQLPFIGIDHIQAHLYAPHLERSIAFPYLGVIVSGGHTLIAEVFDFDNIRVMGTTIDDACGEAFDKVAKYYDLGYPGGVAIDELADKGNPKAFSFPHPSLHKGEHTYDVSYSGLKNAVANQLDLFWNKKYKKSSANIAASFQKTAIDILTKKVLKAAKDTHINRIVFGGGVAANSYLRQSFNQRQDLEIIFPSLKYCTDNAAMIAGLAFHKLKRGHSSNFTLSASSKTAFLKSTIKNKNC